MAVIHTEHRKSPKTGVTRITASVRPAYEKSRRFTKTRGFKQSIWQDHCDAAIELAQQIGAYGCCKGYRSGRSSMVFVFDGDELFDMDIQPKSEERA